MYAYSFAWEVTGLKPQQPCALTTAMRCDANAYASDKINVQSIYFQQGREIAKTYVNMIKSYARLDAQSGRYEHEGDVLIVSGFCRIEEKHFDTPLLYRKRTQSFWSSRWHELTALIKPYSDLFSAFCSSFTEFCNENQIETGALCALVRTGDHRTEQRPFPVRTVLPEYIEAIGFPYQIRF